MDLFHGAVQCAGDIPCRREVGNVVHQKIDDPVEQLWVADSVFALNIAHDQRIKHFGNVVVFRLGVAVEIRPCHAALQHVIVKGGVFVRSAEILQVFGKGEGEHLDFKGSAGEQGGEIGAQKKGVRAGDIQVIFLCCMKAVDGFSNRRTSAPRQ